MLRGVTRFPRRRYDSVDRSRSSAFVVFAAAVLVAVAAVAAGCGSSSSTSASAPTTLTIANPNYPPTMDPGLADNSNSEYLNLAYEPLIVYAADGSFEPGLALSWEYGPRNESFSMKLRPNVKFSDGEKLDAAAVKTWLEHAMTFPNPKAYLANLESIDVTGPLSLTLKFSQPTPLLEMIFSQFLEVGMVASPKAVKEGTLNTETAGAGPYMLDKAATVARDHYTFVPNPNYWNKKKIYWDKVVDKVITSPSAALQALKTGQAQVAPAQPVENIAAATAAGLKYVAPPALLMALNPLDREGKTLKPLGDVRVRQALNYAIDRKSVSDVLNAGQGKPIAQMAVSTEAEGYDAAFEKRYPYDPEKAKQLLAEAGYPNGFTLPAVSVNLVGQDKLAQLLEAQLEKVGVTLKPDIKSDFGNYAEEIESGNYPAATLSWGPLPAALNYQLLWGPNASSSNPFKNTDPRLNRIYDKLIAAPPGQEGKFAQEMQGFLVDEAWFVPVSASPLVVLYSPDITGVVANEKRDNWYTNEYRPAG
jgi:peptide/nickel transport system substrate-binding protein